jgi:hypothetical protein
MSIMGLTVMFSVKNIARNIQIDHEVIPCYLIELLIYVCLEMQCVRKR